MDPINVCPACFGDVSENDSFQHQRCGKFCHKSCLAIWTQTRVNQRVDVTCLNCNEVLNIPLPERNAEPVPVPVPVHPHVRELSVCDVILPIIILGPVVALVVYPFYAILNEIQGHMDHDN